MEIFFLLLRNVEDMQMVADLIGEFGKIIESAVFVLPVAENGQFYEAFIAAFTVEMNITKIDKITKDRRICESTRWIFYMEKKAFQLYDVLREAAIPVEKYREWALNRQPTESIVSLYERNLGKEEVLTKWGKALYFYIKTNFNDEVTEMLVRYWVGLIESGQEIFMRMPKDPEPLEDEELGLNSSFFLMKQKLVIWMFGKRQSDSERFEIISEFYPKLELNIKFVNEDSETMIQFSKFIFARFLASRNLGNFALQNWMIREKIRCLELALCAKIWIGHELEPSLFDSQVLRRPVEREKWDSYVQKLFKESLDSFISKAEEMLEFLINERTKAGHKRCEAFLRLQYVSFLLAFNINTKFQSKINFNLKSLKKFGLQFKSIQKNIFALELEHYTQLKNYKRIAVLLSKLSAFDGIDIVELVPSLWQRLPDKNMFIDEIDSKILNLTDFGLKKYQYTARGLELCIFLEFSSEIENLELKNVKLTLGTGTADAPTVESFELASVILEQQSGSLELTFLYPLSFQGNVTFLIIQTLEFRYFDILFRLSEFPEIQNKNIDLDSLQCLCINSSGFLNRLGPDLLFFEENGPNYFYIEFSVFDNRQSKLKNLIIDIQKSSKYLILNPNIKLFSDGDARELTCEFERIRFPEITGGRYVLVLTLYLLHSKMKNYKLKLNCQSRGKPFSNVLNLKAKHESFYYLENQLQYVSEDYSQLRVSNKNTGLINIHQINETTFSPTRPLRTNEELSLIVRNQGEANLVYELVGLKFQPQPIHAIVGKHEPDSIKTGSKIKGKVLRIEQFILNKDLNIKSLDIKNKKEVKIFEQNHFILHYKFNGTKSDDAAVKDSSQAKKIYLELKWNREKFCIIGKHRFLLKCDAKEKRKEIAFIPFESGFLAYPQILLVETKADGSEIQHLLNEHKHLKIFFVHENVIKAAQYSSKVSRYN